MSERQLHANFTNTRVRLKVVDDTDGINSSSENVEKVSAVIFHRRIYARSSYFSFVQH